MNLVWLLDIKKNEYFKVKESEAAEFCDVYSEPYNLVRVDPWYSDGAGHNGKISRIAYGWGTKEDIMIVNFKAKYTNNEAEYFALMAAMKNAPVGSLILCDSQLVVNQIKGKYKVNVESLRLWRDAIKRVRDKKKHTVLWIPREENIAGKALENRKGLSFKN